MQADTAGYRCNPQFDCCFVDSAHNRDTDGFTLLLVGNLLKPGGWLGTQVGPRDSTDKSRLIAPAAGPAAMAANKDAMRDWRSSPSAGPVDVFGQPPITVVSATAVQRTHECGTDRRPVGGALRELLG